MHITFGTYVGSSTAVICQCRADITHLLLLFLSVASMSVDPAVVDYWLKELMPTFTQVMGQSYLHIAGSPHYSVHVFAKDIQEAKHMIALLLVNDVRNLGDMKHTDSP